MPIKMLIPIRLRNPIRIAVAALFVLYVVQFCSFGFQETPGILGETVQEISFVQTDRTNSSNEPIMRSIIAIGNNRACDFWNFEAFWGRCVAVSIDVLDYDSSKHASILQRGSVIAEALSRPCETVDTLGMADASRLKNNLGCKTSWRPFKVIVRLSSVQRRARSLYGNYQYKYFWNVDRVQSSFLYIIRRGQLQ
jgi:hypothetical protein